MEKKEWTHGFCNKICYCCCCWWSVLWLDWLTKKARFVSRIEKYWRNSLSQNTTGLDQNLSRLMNTWRWNIFEINRDNLSLNKKNCYFWKYSIIGENCLSICSTVKGFSELLMTTTMKSCFVELFTEKHVPALFPAITEGSHTWNPDMSLVDWTGTAIN